MCVYLLDFVSVEASKEEVDGQRESRKREARESHPSNLRFKRHHSLLSFIICLKRNTIDLSLLLKLLCHTLQYYVTKVSVCLCVSVCVCVSVCARAIIHFSLLSCLLSL